MPPLPTNESMFFEILSFNTPHKIEYWQLPKNAIEELNLSVIEQSLNIDLLFAFNFNEVVEHRMIS